MIEVITITGGFLFVNTYLVFDKDTLDAVIVDASAGFEQVGKYINQLKLNVHGLLLTHGHFDHIMTAKDMQDGGIKVYVHNDDADKLRENDYSLFAPDFPKLDADILFEEGELQFGSLNVKIIHTPGHSRGGVCFVIENMIFSGDTLFNLSVGRTDFSDGSHEELINSIKSKILALNKDYKIYPGHGESTTLFFERENNEYLI